MKRLLCLLGALVLVLSLYGCRQKDYELAQTLYTAGNYKAAREIFSSLGGYEDSAKMVTACGYGMAKDAYNAGELERAEAVFTALGDYGDSRALAQKCRYEMAVQTFEAGEFSQARKQFEALEDYDDSARYAEDARWLSIGQYIRARGQVRQEGITAISADAGDAQVYLGVREGAEDGLIFWVEKTMDLGFYTQVDGCAITYTRGAETASYTLFTDTLTQSDGMTGQTRTTATGQVALGTLTGETVLERQNFHYYAMDVYGTEYESDTPAVTDLLASQDLLGVLLEQIPALLKVTDTGYTAQELGFAGSE